jgi:hypothetical protein
VTDEPQGLEFLFGLRAELRDSIEELKIQLDEVDAQIAKDMPPEGYDFDDTRWVVSRSAKTTWDHDRVLSTLAVRALSMREPDETTGEIPDPVQSVIEAVTRCAGISYWRVGNLTQYDMAPGQYCDKEWGRPRVVAKRN